MSTPIGSDDPVGLSHSAPPVTPWVFAGTSAPLRFADERSVTLVRGASFCLSSTQGDLHRASTDGFYTFDTRFLSWMKLRANGAPIEGLSVEHEADGRATFVGRMHANATAGSVVVIRRRALLDRSLVETIELRNYTRAPIVVEVSLGLGTDFSDIFSVKEGRDPAPVQPVEKVLPNGLVVTHPSGLSTTVTADDLRHVSPQLLQWSASMLPTQRWSTTIVVSAGESAGGDMGAQGSAAGEGVPALAVAAASVAGRAGHRIARPPPIVLSDHVGLETAARHSIEDLAALEIVDDDRPDQPVVAAGAPWFMTLFGRDAIFAAWMAWLIRPELAIDTAETLARLQGTRCLAETDEEPGRILHEVRHRSGVSSSLSNGTIYYGSADATPLFVMLVERAWRLGATEDRIRALLPSVDAALNWIEVYGDRDDDQFVEYQRATLAGLVNQSWKDSADSVSFDDGTLAHAPIATCEVQAYTIGAWRSGSALAAMAGDTSLADLRRRKAAALTLRFDTAFWMPGEGTYAAALDGEKRQVDTVTSNPGHALWVGAVPTKRLPVLCARLLAPDMFTGWGVRTLSSGASRFDPLSYHNGSVWPHDNAILHCGLVRSGATSEANRLAEAMLATLAHNGGRFPELFAGLTRDEVGVPVGYPSACSPQAWSAAAPLLMVQSMLGVDPDIPSGTLTVRPTLPPSVGRLEVKGLSLGADVVDLKVEHGWLTIRGLSNQMRLNSSIGSTRLPA